MNSITPRLGVLRIETWGEGGHVKQRNTKPGKKETVKDPRRGKN